MNTSRGDLWRGKESTTREDNRRMAPTGGTAGDLERVKGARALKRPETGVDESLEEFGWEPLRWRGTEAICLEFRLFFLKDDLDNECVLPRGTESVSMSVSSSVLSLDCELQCPVHNHVL